MTPFAKIAIALTLGLTLAFVASSQGARAGISLSSLGDSVKHALATR